MAQAWEYIKIALMNIRSNKGRSVLTMLGIIIGITSVIMIISIGDGVKGQVSDELNAMAGGLIDIYVNNDHSEDQVYFTEEDFEAVREKVPGVKGRQCDRKKGRIHRLCVGRNGKHGVLSDGAHHRGPVFHSR